MSDNNINNEKKKAEEEGDEFIDQMNDYLQCLVDASKQRHPGSSVQSEKMANAIADILGVFQKYEIRDLEQTVHILTSIVLIPIQILVRDPTERARLMRDATECFVEDITKTQLKDFKMQGSEEGDELDRLRDLTSLTRARKRSQRK